jgi:hypothetical protein
MSSIKYYYKETTNQIFVSGSSTKSGMNTLIDSIKDTTPILNANYTSKISSLGAGVSYVVDNGVEHRYLVPSSTGINYSSIAVTNAAGGTPITNLNGSLNGTNAALTVVSTEVTTGVFAVTQVSILSGNGSFPLSDGWQVGETITITAAQLNFIGINTSDDIVITLQASNINFTSTTIPIGDNQELYVSRGFNTVGGDGDTYNYNPYLHRPYKSYILTETGSGTPANPYLPVGSPVNTNVGNSTGTIFNDAYDYAQLSVVGNEGGGNVSQSLDSGSFTIYHDTRDVDFWIFTKYHTLSSFPIAGAFYSIYEEHASESFNSIGFNASTAVADPGAGKVAINNSTQQSATKISLANSYAIGLNLGPYSQSFASHGQTLGKIRIEQNSNPSNNIIYDVTSIDNIGPGTYWEFTVANGTLSNPNQPFLNGVTTNVVIQAPQLVNRINQSRGVTDNQVAQVSTQTLTNGEYSYTSSAFTTTAGNGTPASGSTQFGLLCQYNDYVTYRAELDSSAATNITITFTGSDGNPQYFELLKGFYADYNALVGTPSFAGTINYNTFSNNITNPSYTTNVAPVQGIFASKVNDVYISYSSSLSSSQDGLYVFNQLPSGDIQVTASMLVDVWRGEEPGAVFGTDDYGTGDYGEQTSTPGTTWTTASISIYTGSFPNSIPNIGSTPLTSSELRSSTIHTTPEPYTMSLLIPSESISFQDCLNVSISVSKSTGDVIQNSLVVKEYNLEFNNQLAGGGAKPVPTLIENAFSGSESTNGFSNAYNCQPILNNVSQYRRNKLIQEVDYSTDPYSPINFQQILSGSARKSTVPESNYTTLPSILPRYNGSRSTANGVNTIEGLGGEGGNETGFGVIPVVDYLTAYFGFANQIIDPYPVVNNKILLNVQYLINEAGDALQPTLSPYTAYDLEGSWTEGMLGRIGINQVSGSSQYDNLNGFQTIHRVAKEPVAVLWSQTGASTFAISGSEDYPNTTSSIPLAGNPDRVSSYDAPFCNYGLAAQGNVFNASDFNEKLITLSNLLGGITSSIAVNTTDIDYPTDYGLSGSGVNIYVSSSLITQSVSEPNYVGNAGEYYFTPDPFATNPSITSLNPPSLSDDYKIVLNYQQESSAIWKVKTDNGGFWDSSDYNESYIGYIVVRLQKTTNTSLTTNSWTNCKMKLLSEPSLLGYYGNGSESFNLRTILGQNNAGLRLNRTEFKIRIHWKQIKDAFTQAGKELKNADYLKYIINLSNADDENLVSGTRYRWYVDLNYQAEPLQDKHNFWNPTYSWYTDWTKPNLTVGSPFFATNIEGDLGGQSSTNNALNYPYWDFSQSAAQPVLNVIELQSPNGNTSYGVENGYYQGFLPYTASSNEVFPGGLEPADTVIAQNNIPWSVMVGDEIRFENNESKSFRIQEVITPQENNSLNQVNKLKLILDNTVSPSTNLNFFILRRYRYSPNSIVIDNIFPYGGLPAEKEFVVSNNTTTNFFDASGEVKTGDATTSSAVQTPSGSFIDKYQPLLKQNNTPSGIIFPQYPIAAIELEPDKVIRDLRDKKLIE